MAVKADVSNADAVTTAVEAVCAAYGPITVLFNHAGTIIIKPFLETTEQDWDWLHAINVKGMFLTTKAVLPQMIAAGGGSISRNKSRRIRFQASAWIGEYRLGARRRFSRILPYCMKRRHWSKKFL